MVDHECPVRLGDSMGCSMGGSIRDVTEVGGGGTHGVWHRGEGSTGVVPGTPRSPAGRDTKAAVPSAATGRGTLAGMGAALGSVEALEGGAVEDRERIGHAAAWEGGCCIGLGFQSPRQRGEALPEQCGPACWCSSKEL